MYSSISFCVFVNIVVNIREFCIVSFEHNVCISPFFVYLFFENNKVMFEI